MLSKSDNKEIMINDKTGEIVKELFEQLLNRHQNNLEKLMKDSEFVFDYVHLLYHKCHKINPNRGESYIGSPDWIKNKKATINPINKKYNKCFQYTVTVALNHKVIQKPSERITKTKPFISKYNWEGINFPSERDDWGKIKRNSQTIAPNVLYAKKEKTDLAYVSKHNSNREKQVILLIVPNGEGWHYLVVKKLSVLFRGITAKYHGGFYCLNCLHSFATKNKR